MEQSLRRTSATYAKQTPSPPGAPPRFRHHYGTRSNGPTNNLAQATTPSMMSDAEIEASYSHHIAAHVHCPVTGRKLNIRKLRKGPEGATWTRSLANEWGRLLHKGIGQNRPAHERVEGTGTCFFVTKESIPKDRKISYGNFVCDIRPQKAETHRVRLTAGGDRLDAFEDTSSPAVGLVDAKLHFNSTISDAHKGARHLGLDIKNFYLGTPMEADKYQYLRVHKDDIPDEVFDEYDVPLDNNGYAYLEVRRGMYGLKEAGIIAFKQLVRKLHPYGYLPCTHTPGLCHHTTRPTTFTLCVDDFGVKYFTRADALHLINAIKDHYQLTIDWASTRYCGLTLDWNYTKGYVDVSMPGYVSKALERFLHPAPAHPQHAPHKWTAPVFGRRAPQAPTSAASGKLLDAKGKQRVQQITGTFLYYGRGVDPTILPALNEISSQQAAPTEETLQKCNMLMDYLHTHPDAKIRYHASDMRLYLETDAAYLVLPQARSRCAAYFYLSNNLTSPTDKPRMNGTVHVLCKTIPNVVSSAAEAETGGIYLGAKDAVPQITALEEMGHPQSPKGVLITTDNSTAHGILTSAMRAKLSKAFDMRYYWVKDRIRQKQFDIRWDKGSTNLADYFTKHHAPAHHIKMRRLYLQATGLPPVANTTRASDGEGVSIPPTSVRR